MMPSDDEGEFLAGYQAAERDFQHHRDRLAEATAHLHLLWRKAWLIDFLSSALSDARSPHARAVMKERLSAAKSDLIAWARFHLGWTPDSVWSDFRDDSRARLDWEAEGGARPRRDTLALPSFYAPTESPAMEPDDDGVPF